MNTQLKYLTVGLLMRTGVMLAVVRPAAAVDVIYGPVYNPDNHHIYYVLSPSDYFSAARKAIEMGGYPVKIDNADENRWVDYTFAGFVGARIGATDTYSEGTWFTYDGQTLPYSDWASGEPNNTYFAEQCAHFYSGPGAHWNDGPCNTAAYAIVEAEDCNADGIPDNTGAYGLTAQYCNLVSSVCVWARDPVVQFNWGPCHILLNDDPRTPPGPVEFGIDPYNAWSVHWTGLLRPDKTEHYTFYLTRGSYGYATLDSPTGQRLFSLNANPPDSTVQATVSLTAGVRYPITVIYWTSAGFWGGENPYIRLEWASPSTLRQVIPQSAFVSDDADCNNNFIGDECDIADCDGSTWCSDCNTNGVPDGCELVGHDCNNNGILDACDVLADPSKDCDNNDIPDECELADHDCNGNEIYDGCEIAAGTAHDCNGNGVPDACDITSGLVQCPVDVANACLLDGPAAQADCNNNGITDLCDIQAGTSTDVNHNLIADECEPDCNNNGIPDDDDLKSGVLHDCDDNKKMDECEIPVAEGGFCTAAACPGTDCDLNGVLDVCDINRGTHTDCNYNSMPDFCDIRDGRAEDCNLNVLPDECEIAGQDCNQNGVPDSCDVGSGVLEDCNEDGLPDLCETTLVMDQVSGAASSNLFRRNRERTTYQNMIAAYGRPWQPGFNQRPGLLRTDDPASKLRALLTLRTCDSALTNIQPVMPELFAFEMALGNEAFADALDSTIGLNGISPADLGDKHAFQGVGGISSLLDEELALLRGRDLPGNPADWLNDQVYYPAYTDGTHTTRAAIYNRLPPNAGAGSASLAYISNYGPGVNGNYDAAVRYPQGHGDAFGYYLAATKVYLSTFRGRPDDPAHNESELARELIAAQPVDNESVSSPAVGVVNLPYMSVRQMVVAMAARARAVLHIVDRTYRRDYREDPDDPAIEQVLEDVDRERAWGTADWARRGAIGAYLDWAVANQLVPTAPAVDPNNPPVDPPLTQVDRSSLSEFGELTAAVAEMQERVDRAGAGLSPLGLIPNVVPFGINAAELGPGTGRSHYEQVRDAAVNALNNAREVLGYANQASQRLREQAESQDQFAAQIEDSEADFTNRLIEVFGYPSRSDFADNDFDPSTTDQQEAESAPDLVNFMLDDAALASRSYEPRGAPGEVQLAAAEAKLALRRIEEAADALSNLTKQIKELQSFREFLAAKGQDLTSIVDQFGAKQADLKSTLIDAEQDTIDAQFYAAWALKTAASGVMGGLQGAGLEKMVLGGAIAGAIAGAAVTGMDMWLADLAKQEEDNQFDYNRAQEQLNVWKDVQLQMADIDIQNQEKFLELQSLIRQLPQYRLNVKTAKDNHLTAVGRLKAAIQRGNRLIAERDRIRKLRRDQLQEYRWGDLAYRNFRNNALQKYDAFFNLAARYVMLAGRAYAYEYNSRDQAYLILDNINRERMLGNPVGSSGGLQGVITDLDNLAQVNKFNTPLTSVGQRSFSLRTHMLGLPGDSTGDLKFRSFLERQIVQNLQELPAMQDFAQVSVAAHYGPAIVLPFFSEVAGNNFFGNGPDAPYGGANFPVSLNTKLRNFAIRLQGVDADALGIDPENAYVSVFLMPLGQSVLRENTNAPTVEDNEPRAWSVVDQWLPAPPLVNVENPAVQDRHFSPWISTANSGGNYLNAIKRFRETEAQIDLGQAIEFKSDLAGRSVWNTQWMLVIPGKQWTANTSPEVIRDRLMTFIYGATGDPAGNAGITDIRIVMQAYAN